MGRILVAEDDPQVGHVLAERLKEDGHAVKLAADAETALEYMKKRAVDLILLDLRLPGKSGLDMFNEMRDTPAIARQNMVVVVLTNVDD
ncbi:MAG: response regulator, partial [Candidatus Andersenbacteria bacterium]|nr:response regulator [Candidatus Andersenbacteria bacterium]